MASQKTGWIEAIFLGTMRFLRPLLGPEGMCIFAPYTCTLYAADQLRHQKLQRAIFAIAWRLLCCNPLNAFIRRRRGRLPLRRLY